MMLKRRTALEHAASIPAVDDDPELQQATAKLQQLHQVARDADMDITRFTEAIARQQTRRVEVLLGDSSAGGTDDVPDAPARLAAARAEAAAARTAIPILEARAAGIRARVRAERRKDVRAARRALIEAMTPAFEELERHDQALRALIRRWGALDAGNAVGIDFGAVRRSLSLR